MEKKTDKNLETDLERVLKEARGRLKDKYLNPTVDGAVKAALDYLKIEISRNKILGQAVGILENEIAERERRARESRIAGSIEASRARRDLELPKGELPNDLEALRRK